MLLLLSSIVSMEYTYQLMTLEMHICYRNYGIIRKYQQIYIKSPISITTVATICHLSTQSVPSFLKPIVHEHTKTCLIYIAHAA